MPDTRLTTQSKNVFISERPIIWQAWLDFTEVSKGQVIPALIMGMATFIAAVLTGQITSFWWGFAFVVGSVLAGFVLYAVIAIVRAPLIVITQHHRQISDVNQRLAEVEARSFNITSLPLALPPSETPAQIDATSFEFTNFLVVDRWLSIGKPGLTDDKPSDERDAEILKYPVMLARLYYKPARDVPPVVYVKAHIAIADSQGAPVQPRYDAVWDESSENVYKGFSTASTHALAIALLPKESGMQLCTYQYVFRSERFSPVFDPVPGKEFVFQLELIGKVNNVTVLNAPMRFLLSLEPHPTLTFLG